MADEVKKNTEVESTVEKKDKLTDSRGNTYETSIDWAEQAYQELADYIEEQGIYIRY